MTGTVIPLEEVPDEAFAGAMMGDGAAIVPTDGSCRPRRMER